ncbi:Aldo/keto reductase [Hymenopellis radicata]|nr:Aldo/keto reductase [Hymenopellis radicata]
MSSFTRYSVYCRLILSQLVIEGEVLSNQYNTDDHLESTVPLRVVRLAFRYGIRTIDTSIYYGPSELVLEKALQAIKEEFPRSSYQIMTKCGRVSANEFNYHPDAIRDSVKRSLERLQTDYLDTVYLHDTEFVCTPVGHRSLRISTSDTPPPRAAHLGQSAVRARQHHPLILASLPPEPFQHLPPVRTGTARPRSGWAAAHGVAVQHGVAHRRAPAVAPLAGASAPSRGKGARGGGRAAECRFGISDTELRGRVSACDRL